MLKFIAIGSGSSGNCYYLANETDSLLIDLGVGINTLKKCFREYNISFEQIHNILITHDHSDHIKIVGRISNDYHIPVYTTRKVHEGIERNIERNNERISRRSSSCSAKSTYGIQKSIPADCKHFVEKGVSFRLGSFKITPFEVPHDSSDNVGYAIESEGILFCLMTDIGHLTDEMLTYIGKADYLVIEANYDQEKLINGPYPVYLKERILGLTGHLSNKDCGVALAEYASPHLRHIWLCHLSKTNNSPELALGEVEDTIRETVENERGHDFVLHVPIDVLERGKTSDLFKLAE